jgi:hypothetical protein
MITPHMMRICTPPSCAKSNGDPTFTRRTSMSRYRVLPLRLPDSRNCSRIRRVLRGVVQECDSPSRPPSLICGSPIFPLSTYCGARHRCFAGPSNRVESSEVWYDDSWKYGGSEPGHYSVCHRLLSEHRNCEAVCASPGRTLSVAGLRDACGRSCGPLQRLRRGSQHRHLPKEWGRIPLAPEERTGLKENARGGRPMRSNRSGHGDSAKSRKWVQTCW